uniref:Uncharacterized protein n=1 Tax=Siphoviridae sp. ctjbm8 TaxID=2825634 RepID=A0A8S5VGF0_9CAUD|nr:MAG TPA: hypothetical protein [Siphoviridae sp. ctjbm8]
MRHSNSAETKISICNSNSAKSTLDVTDRDKRPIST